MLVDEVADSELGPLEDAMRNIWSDIEVRLLAFAETVEKIRRTRRIAA